MTDKKDSLASSARSVSRRWHATLFRPASILTWPVRMARYWSDWIKFSGLLRRKRERLSLLNSYPCLYDKTSTTDVDPQYFYQGYWAMRRVFERRPKKHVDIGSDNSWVGWLTTFVPVVSIDLRPLPVEVKNLECRSGSVLDLPLEDNSVESISCLHVVEHVGLGRYGDPLDTEGTVKACRELARVTASGGMLYLSLPIGKPRVCFNAHRVIDPPEVVSLCQGMKLVEFSVIDDKGRLIENCEMDDYRDAKYACGLFIFTAI
ncbi:DUF268 domain-containing protein [Verrucomicrobiota bacterium]